MVLTCKDKNQLISIQAYHHNLIKYKKTDTFFIIKNNVNNINNVNEMINEIKNNVNEIINETNNNSNNNKENHDEKILYINNKNLNKN
jgi:hypothetical protein